MTLRVNLLVLGCSLCIGLLNVIILVRQDWGRILRMGISLGLCSALGMRRVLTPVNAIFDATIPSWTHVALIQLGWWWGTCAAMPRQGSELWQVLVSGLFHGFLLAGGQDTKGVFGTLTQLWWQTGLLSPVWVGPPGWAWLWPAISQTLLVGGAWTGHWAGQRMKMWKEQ